MSKSGNESLKGIMANSSSKSSLPHSCFLQIENREYGVCDIYMVFANEVVNLTIHAQ